MAISEETAAVVAAQLTAAWATIYAAKPGAGGLLEPEIAGRVAGMFDTFKRSVTTVDVVAAVKHHSTR